MRGDSGQTDSQFLYTQKILQQKNRDYMKDMEQELERKALITRFANKVGKTRVSLWQKIKELFT
tara:strand:- start:82 stop:273 length:192 start_codon:yes stop_codon:yes gene_type:complete